MDQKEKEILQSRFSDLYQRSRNRGIYTFSGFLYEADAVLAYQAAKERDAVVLDGGYPEAERVIVRFGKEQEIAYHEPFPIAILEVTPVNRRYAEDLTHRDVLGALMSLGIERDTIGDILLKEGTAWIFALDGMADYICAELTQIRHTTVRVRRTGAVPADARPQTEEVPLNVASSRADAVTARLYHLSRKEAAALFSAGRILINGMECHAEDRMLKEADTVTVRGFGRFRFLGMQKETKKKREVVLVERY